MNDIDTSHIRLNLNAGDLMALIRHLAVNDEQIRIDIRTWESYDGPRAEISVNGNLGLTFNVTAAKATLHTEATALHPSGQPA